MVPQLQNPVSDRHVLCALKKYNVILCRNRIVMFHPVFQTRKHPLFVSAESIMKIIDQRLFVINLLHEHSVRKACWPDYDDFVLEVAKFMINNAVEFTDKV